MRTLGIVTSGLGGLLAAVVVVVGIRSLPDIRRYLRIRSM